MSDSQKKEKKGNPYFFPIAMTIMLLILVPYIYYAIQINIYGNKHLPANHLTPFPKFTDAWRVLVGAFVTQIVRFIVHKVMPGVYAPLAKGDDEDTKRRYTYKACEHTYRAIYFASSAYWGWYVLKDSPYLYESLGGPPGGDLLKMKLDDFFLVYDQSLLEYSLYTFGFHFGNFVQH